MSTRYLRRYVDLPALIYLLNEHRITLLDPQSWDDSNDSHFLALYREKRKLKSVLALCFTQAEETYHHWRVFANGPSGVCIRFRRSKLLKSMGLYPGIRSGPITYMTLDEIKGKPLQIRDLPFLKRYAFHNEKEYRMIYEADDKKRKKLDIGISFSCIDGITLSPWIPRTLYQHVKNTILSIAHCDGLQIVQSTLISNEEWKSRGEAATDRLAP